MTNLFITGSGTGVGKTFITALLVRQLRALGIAAHALKPVVTGYTPATACESDTQHLLDAMGTPAAESWVDSISPWRFAAPLAPSMAARLEGRHIDLASVIAFSRSACHDAKITLIEGIGGVLVPLNDTDTVRDWIKMLEIPALLVTGSYLGSISHALTALEALRTSDITVAGIVVSESANSTVSLDDTVADIARFAKGVHVQLMPRLLNLGCAPDLTYLVTGTAKGNR